MKPTAKVVVVVAVALVVSCVLWMMMKREKPRTPDAVSVAPMRVDTSLTPVMDPSRPMAMPTMPPGVYPTEGPGIMGWMDPEDDDYGLV